MRTAIVAAALALMAAPAAAQPVDQEAAARQLFAPRGIQLAVSRSLSEQERSILTQSVEEMERIGHAYRFYGSIAYSPSEGVASHSLRAAVNFHSTEAADRAAIAACNAARVDGSASCQVAAHILPRGYEPGRVQLSYDATNAFRSAYRRMRGEKALAVSPSTPAWGLAEGGGAAAAAVAQCNQGAEAAGAPRDCEPRIVN